MSTLLGVAITLAGVLLVFGALPPNRWVGVRTKRTASDALAWYRTHKALGWVTVLLGTAIALFSMWPTYPAHPALPLVCVVVVAAAVVWVYLRYAA